MDRTTSRRALVPLLLIAATALVACAGGHPGRGDPLEGWRPIESRAEDRTEYVRDAAIIHVLEPREITGDVFAAAFLDDEATKQRMIAVTGSPNVADISRSPLRVHDVVHWTDLAFELDGVARMVRIAWFDSEDGLRVFRLITARHAWNTRDLSAFQNHVAQSAREHAPASDEPPPEPED